MKKVFIVKNDVGDFDVYAERGVYGNKIRKLEAEIIDNLGCLPKLVGFKKFANQTQLDFRYKVLQKNLSKNSTRLNESQQFSKYLDLYFWEQPRLYKDSIEKANVLFYQNKEKYQVAQRENATNRYIHSNIELYYSFDTSVKNWHQNNAHLFAKFPKHVQFVYKADAFELTWSNLDKFAVIFNQRRLNLIVQLLGLDNRVFNDNVEYLTSLLINTKNNLNKLLQKNKNG